MTYVWVVLFSNYEPAEIAEIYDNEAAAKEHAERLGDLWHTERWPVRSHCVLDVQVGDTP